MRVSVTSEISETGHMDALLSVAERALSVELHKPHGKS